MSYKFSELIDVEKLQGLSDKFTDLTGAVTAILDLDGKILTASGWQDICTKFHRVHPETCLRCTKSDTILAGRLAGTQVQCLPMRKRVDRCRLSHHH